MFPTDPFIPPELAAHLRALGVDLPAKPRDAASDRAARTGMSEQWKPAYPGEEAPF